MQVEEQAAAEVIVKREELRYVSLRNIKNGLWRVMAYFFVCSTKKVSLWDKKTTPATSTAISRHSQEQATSL